MTFELTLDEGKFLIHLARNAVKTYLETGKTVKAPESTPKKLFERCGVFVTINMLKSGDKRLRGCIGYPYPTSPLVEAVIDSAINAATQDPRFYPLSLGELGNDRSDMSIQMSGRNITAESQSRYLNEALEDSFLDIIHKARTIERS